MRERRWSVIVVPPCWKESADMSPPAGTAEQRLVRLQKHFNFWAKIIRQIQIEAIQWKINILQLFYDSIYFGEPFSI